jgi:hypothetical protein
MPASGGLVNKRIRHHAVPTGRRLETSSPVSEIDAKKAEGAKAVALLIPKPPHLTGSIACSTDAEVKLTFKQLAIKASTDASNFFVTLERKHGETRR